jgi:Na+/proline symporter
MSDLFSPILALALSPMLVLTTLLLYFLMLVGVAWLTSRNSTNESFFLANRQVPWYVVAYAMIGTSISGVTFISLPGYVGMSSGEFREFGYLQTLMGYMFGYLFVAMVLMPLYYRLSLTSIYGYLEQRFGTWSYRSGAAFFILARTLGSAARMFLAAVVLQNYVFEPLGVPFVLTVVLMLALIYGYTYRGGLQTIIWTDTIMTTFFIVAMIWTVVTIASALNLNSVGAVWNAVTTSGYSKVFFWDSFATDPNHFVKQFVTGILTVIVMTGLDQDLMQKNLACKNIKEAQKNMLVFFFYLVIINIAFLTLGALLYQYANSLGLALPAKPDKLYPMIAFDHLNVAAGIFFILGLIASTYASSDSALTALTTSFCVDFLGFEKKQTHPDQYAPESEKAAYATQVAASQKRTRTWVHLGFSVAFVVIILLLNQFSDSGVLGLIFKIAGYTYGPLLGLFMFGLFTNYKLHDRLVPYVCVAAPILTFVIEWACTNWLHVNIGFLTILVNGLVASLGLWIVSYKD